MSLLLPELIDGFKTSLPDREKMSIVSPDLLREDQDVKGVVRPNFGSLPLLFPLSPSICKVQTSKVPFSSDDPIYPLAIGPIFLPIFLLDSVFLFPYTLSIKMEILIKHQISFYLRKKI